jgi:hypothetical protein
MEDKEEKEHKGSSTHHERKMSKLLARRRTYNNDMVSLSNVNLCGSANKLFAYFDGKITIHDQTASK